MKDVRRVLDLKERNKLRIGVLLLSTLGIIVGTIIVYSRIVYEQALAVGTTGGGIGQMISLDNVGPVLGVVLVFSGIIVSPSLFMIFMHASRRVMKKHEPIESQLPSPMFSLSEAATGSESTQSDENEDDAMKMIRDILHPNSEQSTTSE